MPGLGIFLLKAVLYLLRFTFFLVAAWLFVLATRQRDPLQRTLVWRAGWASLAANMVLNLYYWTRPLPWQLSGDLVRLSSLLAGVTLGLLIASATRRRSLRFGSD